jgi:LPS export ABC transporter protein LptC
MIISLRNWPGLPVLLMLALWAGVLAGGCHEKLRPPTAAEQGLSEKPTQESWNSRVVFSDSGFVKAVLNATHIMLFEKKKTTVLDSGLIVDFYNMDKTHSSRLTADRGLVHDATKDLEAFGHVVFVSDSGTVVHTEYLKWDNGTRKLRSDKFVTVNSPRDKLQGYGFEADQNLRNYVIFKVSGQAQFDDR